MRDILLTIIILGLVPLAIRRVEVGAYVWVWLSMMNPHKLTYGFANSMPFAQLFAIITLVGFIFSRRKKPLPINGGTVVLLLLLIWMTVTSLFAINNAETVWSRWVFVMKIEVMLIITLMLLRGRQHIDWLVWTIVVSIGFFGVKGGLFTLVTGGNGRVWGPPGGMLEENNALAVALVMIMPLMFYLWQVSAKRWVRYSLITSMFLLTFSVLGSQSRGALLALLAMTFALGVKSKHPVRISVLLAVLVLLAIGFMPDSWTQRMDTLSTYSADNSAMSRIYTWRTLWNLVLDRPLVGAGFGADNAIVFTLYAPNEERFAMFQGLVLVAHSIYLQALGEHGFPGFLLFLALGLWTWFAAGQTARLAAADLELAKWVPLLMQACQVSVLGFGVGGAFLSLMNLDVPYYFFGIVVLTQCAVKEKLRSNAIVVAESSPIMSGHISMPHSVVE